MVSKFGVRKVWREDKLQEDELFLRGRGVRWGVGSGQGRARRVTGTGMEGNPN